MVRTCVYLLCFIIMYFIFILLNNSYLFIFGISVFIALKTKQNKTLFNLRNFEKFIQKKLAKPYTNKMLTVVETMQDYKPQVTCYCIFVSI